MLKDAMAVFGLVITGIGNLGALYVLRSVPGCERQSGHSPA